MIKDDHFSRLSDNRLTKHILELRVNEEGFKSKL